MTTLHTLQAWSKAAAGTLLTCFTAFALVTPAFGQAAKPLKKVTLAVGGVTVLNAGYPWLMMPLALGYWKQEGYDVNVIATPGSLQTVQQLASGSIEFAQMSSGVVIQANSMNNLPIRAVSLNSTLDWALSVDESGPIQKVSDLKGKNIGIVSLASGGMPMLQALLRANGLDPEKDVTIVAVGAGAPALEALKSKRVAGLMYWKSAITNFQNAGAKLRLFRSPEWANYADFALATSQKIIDSDPAMVEAIVRGISKATLFTVTNPECVRELHWKTFPETKPTGGEDAVMARNDLALVKSIVESLEGAHRIGGGKVWGQASPAGFGLMQDFMFANNVVDKKVRPETLVIATPGFYDRVGNYDQAAVIRQAKSCSVK